MAEARDRCGRRSPLLRAPRRRCSQHPPRGQGRHHQSRRRPGRLDDHPAARQERDQPERAHDLAQAAGGGARLAARAGQVEGLDSLGVPEHGLLRQRRLRRRASESHLLRPQRRPRARHAGGGGAPGRYPWGAEPLRPGCPSSDRARPAQPRPSAHAAAALPRAFAVRTRDQDPAAEAPGSAPADDPERGRSVLRELRDRPARAEVPHARRLRRRPARTDDHRPQAAEDGS